MSEIDPQRQREFAIDVVRRLRRADFVAYWAGGCVRDRLLGHEPKDYDVATDARPEQVRDLFGHRLTLAIGAAFGVICVLGPPQAGQVEVTTFRTDAGYSDGRRPDSVAYSSAEEDAQRRDFTINGLFYDPIEDRLIDFVGGVEDLQRQVLRAIRDPRERFREDKLRMLRAIRFAATFRFTIDEQTFAAVQEMSGEIGVVSVERIAEEVRRMLEHPQRAEAAGLLMESGLLAMILPEVASLKQQPAPLHTTAHDAFEYTQQVMGTLETAGFPLALATLLHAIKFDDKQQAGQFAHALGRRWKLAVDVFERTAWLLQHLLALENVTSLPWPTLQRILIHENVLDLLALHAARAEVGAANMADVTYCREKLDLPPKELNPPLLLTGDDLITHGVPRGKAYKTLLDAVRDAQLDKVIFTKQQALALVDVLQGKGNVKPNEG